MGLLDFAPMIHKSYVQVYSEITTLVAYLHHLGGGGGGASEHCPVDQNRLGRDPLAELLGDLHQGVDMLTDLLCKERLKQGEW